MKAHLLAAHLALALPLCVPPAVFADPPARPAAAEKSDDGHDGHELTVTDPREPWRALLLPTTAPSVPQELRRFAQAAVQGDWQRCFHSMKTILDTPATGLVPGPDGFLLPLSTRLRQTVAQLTPEGQQAYRVYYDSRARKLIEDAQGPSELAHLTTVASAFFMTSSGRQAADRLGDLYFERGEMDKATQLWQSVLAADAGQEVSSAKLRVKTGIALARAGRWAEFDTLLSALRENHPQDSVALGGVQVGAVEHLEQMAANRTDMDPTTSPSHSSTPPGSSDVRLPKAPQTLWQWRLARQANKAGSRAVPSLSVAPAVVCDPHRAYVNLLGWHFALDLQTGRTAWRSADLAQQTRLLMHAARSSTDRYNVALNDGVLCFVTRNPNQAAESKVLFRLVSVDPQSGRTRWTSRELRALRNWSFLGDPLITSDRVYAVAEKPDPPSQWYMLAVAPATGRLLWSTRIGVHLDAPVRIGFGRSSQPQMVLSQRTLLVETHAGSLAALDADSGELKWGFAYQLPSSKDPRPVPTRAAPHLMGGLLYVKGMRSSGLYGLDLAQPSLTTSLPVPAGSMIIGADDERLYLGGQQLMAIDLNDHSVVWSQQASAGISWHRPLLTRGSLIALTPGGLVEFDKTDGRIISRIDGADQGSLAGCVMATPRALVTVSNQAITAYAIE